MKLIVFGATGGTGQHIVQQALAQGHMATAFVRNPAKFGVSHPNLRIVQGDVMDTVAVERAMPGHDAVLAAHATAGARGPGAAWGFGGAFALGGAGRGLLAGAAATGPSSTKSAAS